MARDKSAFWYSDPQFSKSLVKIHRPPKQNKTKTKQNNSNKTNKQTNTKKKQPQKTNTQNSFCTTHSPSRIKPPHVPVAPHQLCFFTHFLKYIIPSRCRMKPPHVPLASTPTHPSLFCIFVLLLGQLVVQPTSKTLSPLSRLMCQQSESHVLHCQGVSL